MQNIETVLLRYVEFTADQVATRIPHVTDGNQGVDAVLHGDNPLWNDLKDSPQVQDAKSTLESSSDFKSLYHEYSVERPQISFDTFLANTILDFVLKLLRRAPAIKARLQVQPLVRDFMSYMQSKRIEAVEFAPLFNLEMDPDRSIQLDDSTTIMPVSDLTKAKVRHYFSERSIVFSGSMLDRLSFGIFRYFHIPIRSAKIAPPSDSIATFSELIFRLLKPGKIVNCGFSAYWTTGWHLNEHGGSALSSQFPWLGPSYRTYQRTHRLSPVKLHV